MEFYRTEISSDPWKHCLVPNFRILASPVTGIFM